MRAFFRIFRNKWLITFVGFVALAILVWFVGPQIAIAGVVPLQSVVSRVIFLLVVMLLWAINLLRIQIKVNKANTELAGSFGESMVESHSDESARSREEVEALSARFEEALQVLKKNSRSKGRPSIYELPWYIIIGPPGTGKTTALVNSGLHFPLAEKYGNEALRGVGGTRNCDWWFTEDAVLLDTAGRYTTQDSHSQADKAAWDGFLQLLVRYRKRRPINGALIAISISDLLTQTPPERDAQISAIKHRLQELNTQLKASFPVYVLFTKCDLIPGFIEFFDDLGREERGQVWGMTFPYGGAAEADVIDHFGAEFDALINRLNARVVTRMEQERDAERRSLIFSFPQQFDALKQMLDEFLHDIFRGNRYQSDTLLRGVYFTSGTQEGTPIDRVLGSLTRTLGVGVQAYGRESVQGKSYFVTRLFKDLVFPEAGLAGTNRRLEIQRFWIQRFAYGGAVLVTALAVLAWTTSYTRNQVYVNRADDALEHYQDVVFGGASEGDSFVEILEPLNASRSVVEVYEPFREDVPFLMGMGLYQGNRISQAAEEAYRAELERLLLSAVADRLERHLEIGERNPDFQYMALKSYLMLGNTERLQNDVLLAWMELDWGATFERQPEVQGQLQLHLKSILAMGFQPLELNADMIEAARANLKLQSEAELLYGMIKRDYIAVDTAPLTLAEVYGNAGGRVFEQTDSGARIQQIPSLFTYEGYHEYFSKNLGEFVERAEREAWVLSDDPRVLTLPEKKRLRDDLRDLYFADYSRTWERMLGSLQIVPFNSFAQASDVLNVASSPSSPIRRVLDVTARNTTLANTEMLDKAGELGEKVASRSRFGRLFNSVSDEPVAAKVKLPEQVVDDRFQTLNGVTRANASGSTALDPILNLLSQLYGQLDAVAGGFGQDAVTLAKGGQGSEALMRLQVEAARQPEPLRSWLQGVVRNSRSVTLTAARDQINREWQATVFPSCSAALDGRYPFIAGADREVTLADFGKLFAPGGTIDTFYITQILPFTEVRNGRRQWKNVNGLSLGMPEDVLTLFQRAMVIKATFFHGGGSQPSISFKMKPVYLDANVDAVRIDLEGQDFTYRHGPQFQQAAQWPYPSSNGRVRLEFVDESGNRLVQSFEGPWAWFRLLGESGLKSKTGDIAHVTFEHRGRRSSWELHTQSVENPFLINQFSRFRCPERL